MCTHRFQHDGHQSARKYSVSSTLRGGTKRNHSAQERQTHTSPSQPQKFLLNLSPLQSSEWINRTAESTKCSHSTINTCRGPKIQPKAAYTDRSFYALSTPGRGAVDCTEQNEKFCQAQTIGRAWDNYKAFQPSTHNSVSPEDVNREDDILSLHSHRSFSASSYAHSQQSQLSGECSMPSDAYSDGIPEASAKADYSTSSDCDVENHVGDGKPRAPFELRVRSS